MGVVATALVVGFPKWRFSASADGRAIDI